MHNFSDLKVILNACKTELFRLILKPLFGRVHIAYHWLKICVHVFLQIQTQVNQPEMRHPTCSLDLAPSMITICFQI